MKVGDLKPAPRTPDRCIWCLREPPVVTFDLSHVLPECVGNKYQHVLPRGVVCKECNAYFGAKIEPVLLDDPLFHVIAVFLAVVDPDDMNAFRSRIFDATHPPVNPPVRSLNLKTHLKEKGMTLDVSYSIQGQLNRQYSLKDMQRLSRAIHKIAFESLAWSLYVRGDDKDVQEHSTRLDVYSSTFEPIRAWARRGIPQNSVRPVLRRPATTLAVEWEVRQWAFPKFLAAEISLFGDWYAVALTSDHSKALEHLRSTRVPTGKDENIWVIGDSFRRL